MPSVMLRLFGNKDEKTKKRTTHLMTVSKSHHSTDSKSPPLTAFRDISPEPADCSPSVMFATYPTRNHSLPKAHPGPAAIQCRSPRKRLTSIPEGSPLNPISDAQLTCDIPTPTSPPNSDLADDLEDARGAADEHAPWFINYKGEYSPQAGIIHPCEDDDGMPWTQSQDPFAKDPPPLLSRGIVEDYLKVEIPMPHISFPDMHICECEVEYL